MSNESFESEKARRAAKDPRHSGEKCGAEPGTWRPQALRARRI
jgi:hypothetical protein